MHFEITRDLTTVENGIVAHGCNCQGGFGSGIAGAIKKIWPQVAVAFFNNGIGKELLGSIQNVPLNENLTVANCYTQEYYGPGDKKYASIEAIEACLHLLCELAIDEDKDVYVAKIGCGLGGLSWEDEVKPVYETIFAKYPDLTIYVCDI